MTILLADPRVRAVPVSESGEPLVRLGADLSPAGAVVRAGLAERLVRADAALPSGLRLRVAEGHRSAADQQAIIETYAAQLCALHPGIGPADLERLTSRFVAPLDVAPHVAGAAVDLTLVDVSVDPAGVELDLGTPIDATPEQSGGRCFTDSTRIAPAARARRDLLAEVLGAEGLVNYPTEWWHWSHGDRYWALVTGADHALHGPVLDPVLDPLLDPVPAPVPGAEVAA